MTTLENAHEPDLGAERIRVLTGNDFVAPIERIADATGRKLGQAARLNAGSCDAVDRFKPRGGRTLRRASIVIQRWSDYRPAESADQWPAAMTCPMKKDATMATDLVGPDHEAGLATWQTGEVADAIRVRGDAARSGGAELKRTDAHGSLHPGIRRRRGSRGRRSVGALRNRRPAEIASRADEAVVLAGVPGAAVSAAVVLRSGRSEAT